MSVTASSRRGPYHQQMRSRVSWLESAVSIRREYAVGALLLGTLTLYWYWNWLSFSGLGIFDWGKELFFFTALQDSLVAGRGLPLRYLEVPDSVVWYPSLATTDSVIGNPETPFLSPWIAFAWLPVVTFIKAWTVAHLLTAVFGCMLLAQNLRWHPLSGGIMYSLFFLSPWLMQHLAIGYTPWLTICWIPMSVALALRGHWILAGIFASLILWEGGAHVFIWASMAATLVAIAALFSQRRDLVVFGLRALGVTLLAASPRILLVIAESGGLSGRTPDPSYQSLSDVLNLLINTSENPYDLPRAYDIWGVNLYDGQLVVGSYTLVFVAIAIALQWRRVSSFVRWTCLAGGVLFTVLGGFGSWALMAQWFPVLGAEVYPWRFLPIAAAFIAFLVVAALQSWIGRSPPVSRVIVLMVLFLPVLLGFYAQTQFYIRIAGAS